jgi:hypothetical protein
MEQLTKVVPVELKPGVVMWVEATELEPVEQDVAGGVPAKDFQKVADAIREIAGVIDTAWDAVKPKKAIVEFGIEIGVETGGLTALLVKGSGKSNLKVTLEWGERKPAGS